MGLPEGKTLAIDTISQIGLQIIKNHVILREISKILGSMFLGVTPRGLPSEA